MGVMPLTSRYLVPFLPFAALISVYLLSFYTPKILGKHYLRPERVGVVVFAVIMFIVPTWQMDWFKIKFSAFIWKAEKEYVQFSEKFIDGELLITGKKKMVYPLIVKLRYPVRIKYGESGASTMNTSPKIMCVERLDKVPLHLNYQQCTSP